ncbi:MAG TPA: hypothetical protein VFJ82_15585 [Longimicrobium sp.]|nr:hypothetical protein [Longimicrobium sp.]
MIWIALLVAFAIGWSALAWWSWRTIRRVDGRSDLALLRRLPGMGMGVFGALGWPVLSFTQVLRAMDAQPAAALADPHFYTALALNLAILYPIVLWTDFLLRRGIGWFFGIANHPSSPSAATD